MPQLFVQRSPRINHPLSLTNMIVFPLWVESLPVRVVRLRGQHSGFRIMGLGLHRSWESWVNGNELEVSDLGSRVAERLCSANHEAQTLITPCVHFDSKLAVVNFRSAEQQKQKNLITKSARRTTKIRTAGDQTYSAKKKTTQKRDTKREGKRKNKKQLINYSSNYTRTKRQRSKFRDRTREIRR